MKLRDLSYVKSKSYYTCPICKNTIRPTDLRVRYMIGEKDYIDFCFDCKQGFVKHLLDNYPELEFNQLSEMKEIWKSDFCPNCLKSKMGTCVYQYDNQVGIKCLEYQKVLTRDDMKQKRKEGYVEKAKQNRKKRKRELSEISNYNYDRMDKIQKKEMRKG